MYLWKNADIKFYGKFRLIRTFGIWMGSGLAGFN